MNNAEIIIVVCFLLCVVFSFLSGWFFGKAKGQRIAKENYDHCVKSNCSYYK